MVRRRRLDSCGNDQRNVVISNVKDLKTLNLGEMLHDRELSWFRNLVVLFVCLLRWSGLYWKWDLLVY